METNQCYLQEKIDPPFFDFAYQGLGKGIEEDAKIVRFFLEEGHEFLVAYSCSKNFSLYCQRVGALFSVSSNAATKIARWQSNKMSYSRSLFKSPGAWCKNCRAYSQKF